MDKNRYMLDVEGSSKVLFLKYHKQAFIKQAANRKWAFFIKKIGTTKQQLLLFLILKGKKKKDNW